MTTTQMIMRLAAAAILGGLIGIERVYERLVNEYLDKFD